MDFAYSETERMVQTMARDFSRRVLLPLAAGIDEAGVFPVEQIRDLARHGLLAINVPEPYGGASAGALSYALALSEVAYACASTAVTMAVTNMVGETIARYGTPEQRMRHCPRLASGQYLCGAFALSEADAGSDPGGMRTVAVRDGDGWVITGSKQWISHGAYAGLMVVWARTGDPKSHPGTRGLSCFLVESGTPGLRIGRAEDKMGLRGSNTVPLEFDGMRVPHDALLGEENRGFGIAMSALDGGRIGIAAQAVGISRAALDESVAYARERKQFGRPLGDNQAIQWKLAEMKARLDASELLCHRAAWRKDQGLAYTQEASIAKMVASEAAVHICNEAVQIHGGYGYTREFPAERHLRDARVSMIYEGTSEIQRIVIARGLLAG